MKSNTFPALAAVFSALVCTCTAPSMFVDLAFLPKPRELVGFNKTILVVEASDKRTDNKGRPPSYLGRMYGGMLAERAIRTKNDVPLAHAFTMAVAIDLGMLGFSVEIDSQENITRPEVEFYLKNSQAEKVVFIDIYRFLFETMIEADAEWDITLRVEDTRGAPIIQSRARGVTDAPSHARNEDAIVQEFVSRVFLTCLDSLLTPDVLYALTK